MCVYIYVLARPNFRRSFGSGCVCAGQGGWATVCLHTKDPLACEAKGSSGRGVDQYAERQLAWLPPRFLLSGPRTGGSFGVAGLEPAWGVCAAMLRLLSFLMHLLPGKCLEFGAARLCWLPGSRVACTL